MSIAPNDLVLGLIKLLTIVLGPSTYVQFTLRREVRGFREHVSACTRSTFGSG
jgi:hypothetical protein